MQNNNATPKMVKLPTPEGKFYVYTLARPVKGVFYVGKGSGPRVNEHEREAGKGHKCYKCYVIRKVWREGGEIGKEIVFVTSNEQEALDYEKNLIMEYGIFKLVNHHYVSDFTLARPAQPAHEATDDEMQHYLDRFDLKPRERVRRLEQMRADKIRSLKNREIVLRLQRHRNEAAVLRQEIKEILILCERDALPSKKIRTR